MMHALWEEKTVVRYSRESGGNEGLPEKRMCRFDAEFLKASKRRWKTR